MLSSPLKKSFAAVAAPTRAQIASRVPLGVTVLCGALLVSCARTQEWMGLSKAYEETYENGQMRKRGELLYTGPQTGAWEFWYRNGVSRAAGRYSADDQTGDWTYWYKSGEKKMEGPYATRSGQTGTRRHGFWRLYHANGKLSALGWLVNDRENALWSYYSESGELLRRGAYDQGRQTGRWVHFDGSRVVADGWYLHGEKVGVWLYPTAAGASRGETLGIQKGWEILRENHDNGTSRREGFLFGGQRQGFWLTRHPNGAPRVVVEYYRGEPRGELTVYSEDGTPLAAGPLENGRPGGAWITWVNGAERPLEADWIGSAPIASDAWTSSAILEDEALPEVVEIWVRELESPLDPQRRHIDVEPSGAPVDPKLAAEIVDASAVPSPAAVAQPEFTVEERERIAEQIALYTAERKPGGGGTGPYAIPAVVPKGETGISKAIVNKTLPQTSFLCTTGERLDLARYRGKNVLLVILRGVAGKVCVYCASQTRALVPFYAKFSALNTEVLVVYPGSTESFDAFLQLYVDEFGEENRPPYTVLYDTELSFTEALGIRDELAKPTTILLDKTGVVRWAYVGKDKVDRPSAEDVLKEIEKLPR